MVQRKKPVSQQHAVVTPTLKNGKSKDETAESKDAGSEEGKASPEEIKNNVKDSMETDVAVCEDNPSGLVEFEKDYLPKPLKLEETPMPNNSYGIECVVEKLKGSISVAFFKNPGKEGLEPYLPIFKNVWGDNMGEDLLIHGIGYRCDSNHQFKRNKRNIADISQMQYGWSLFINESVKDPGDWAIHLCNSLNDSDSYKNSFDVQRTNGRKPHFEVVHVL